MAIDCAAPQSDTIQSTLPDEKPDHTDVNTKFKWEALFQKLQKQGKMWTIWYRVRSACLATTNSRACAEYHSMKITL
jgi:muconolactone delta-isomerase